MIVYTNLYDITPLQQTIVKFILVWVNKEKVPIPQREIIKEMVILEKNKSTVIHALNGLLKLGYIRRAIVKPANSTSYVLLRTI
jgi:predicted DNA-binding transcriptional regulator